MIRFHCLTHLPTDFDTHGAVGNQRRIVFGQELHRTPLMKPPSPHSTWLQVRLPEFRDGVAARQRRRARPRSRSLLRRHPLRDRPDVSERRRDLRQEAAWNIAAPPANPDTPSQPLDISQGAQVPVRSHTAWPHECTRSRSWVRPEAGSASETPDVRQQFKEVARTASANWYPTDEHHPGPAVAQERAAVTKFFAVAGTVTVRGKLVYRMLSSASLVVARASNRRSAMPNSSPSIQDALPKK